MKNTELNNLLVIHAKHSFNSRNSSKSKNNCKLISMFPCDMQYHFECFNLTCVIELQLTYMYLYVTHFCDLLIQLYLNIFE